MATIGKLTKQADGSYKGSISTLTIKGRDITMRAIDPDQLKERGPLFRVYAGFGEVGPVFEETARDTGLIYLKAKLDDPSFAAPVYVSIFKNKEKPDTDLDLVWSRPKPQE
jgi:uncharacterized protein (DUF736 family)